MYPCCKTLKAAIAKKKWTNADLVQKVARRFNRSRANKVAFNADYIAQLIKGEQYIPDTLRGQIATVLNQSVKSLFPEYLIECQTLQKIRLGEDMTQAELAEIAKEYAFKLIRPFDISAYERGHRFCHPDTRDAIAKSLGLTTDEVFPEYADFAVVS
jgi:hypothetical protein